MTPAHFQVSYGVLPEPMLMASPEGVIGAANQAAAALLGRRLSTLAGLSLSDLACGPPKALARLLSQFSRSGQLVPGALTLKVPNGELVCRVEGARLGDSRSLVLRLQPQHEAVGRFRSLNERIAHLNREIFDRTQAARASALLSAIVNSSDDAIISKISRASF